MGNTSSGETMLDSISAHKYNPLDSFALHEDQPPHTEASQCIRGKPEGQGDSYATLHNTAQNAVIPLGRMAVFQDGADHFVAVSQRPFLPQLPIQSLFETPLKRLNAWDTRNVDLSRNGLDFSRHHSNITTEFCTLLRISVNSQKLLDFSHMMGETHDVQVLTRKLTHPMHIELSKMHSLPLETSEPLICRSPSDVETTIEPCGSLECSVQKIDSGSMPRGIGNTRTPKTDEALCHYSNEMFYDVWVTRTDEGASWTHIGDHDSRFILTNNCAESITQNGLRRGIVSIIRSIFPRKSSVSRGTSRVAAPSNVEEIELILRCCSSVMDVVHKSCIDAMVEETSQHTSSPTHCTTSSPTTVNICTPFGPTVMPKDGVITPFEMHPFSSAFVRRYETVEEKNGNLVFHSFLGEDENENSVEDLMKSLYSTVQPNVYFISSIASGGLVRLRLRLVNNTMETFENNYIDTHARDPDIRMLRCSIVELHGGSLLTLQHLLSQSNTSNRTPQDITIGKNPFAHENTPGVISDVALACILEKWFQNLSCNAFKYPNAKEGYVGLVPLQNIPKVLHNPVDIAFFVVCKPYRVLRVLSTLRNLSSEDQQLCFSKTTQHRLPTLKRVYLERMVVDALGFIKLFGFEYVSSVLYTPDNAFELLCTGVSMLIDHEQDNPLNDKVVQWLDEFVTPECPNSEGSFSAWSLEDVLLVFLDCCFFILLDMARFPESLQHNKILFRTNESITPLWVIFRLYTYIKKKPTDFSGAWTPKLRLAVCHFVAKLSSLIEKLWKSNASPSVWNDHYHEIAHTIDGATCSSNTCEVENFSTTVDACWNLCNLLCEHLPVYDWRRCTALIDYHRFKNEWVRYSCTLDHSDVFRNLAVAVTKSQPAARTEERIQTQIAYDMYKNAAEEAGKVIHLVELQLNVCFFSRLLRRPEARRELLWELHNSNMKKHDFCRTAQRCVLDHAPLTRPGTPATVLCPKSFLQQVLNSNLLSSLSPLRSRLCETRIEFMNFVEVTESTLEDQPGDNDIEINSSMDCQGVDTLFLNSSHEAYILDVVEWLKSFCWVIHFPGLQWYPGCKWVSEGSVVTALIQNSKCLTSEQVSQILKNEIYHSASVLALRSFYITSSFPLFLVDKSSKHSTNRSGDTSAEQNFEALQQHDAENIGLLKRRV